GAPAGTTSSASPIFQWSAASGASGYKIEVVDNTGGANTLVIGPTTVSGTSYTPGSPLTVGHTYQWHLLATDSSGATSSWSSPLTFHVVPSSPSLFSPSGTTSSATPQFLWQPVAGAVTYQVQVTDTSDGSSRISAYVNQPSLVSGIPLTSGHTYRW